MVKSPWVYRGLRNFRAGIEAAISCFKRAYGAGRRTWRGLDHFKAYIWSAVVAHNLVLFAGLAAAVCKAIEKSKLGRPQLPVCRFPPRLSLPMREMSPAPITLIFSRPCYPSEKHAFMDAH